MPAHPRNRRTHAPRSVKAQRTLARSTSRSLGSPWARRGETLGNTPTPPPVTLTVGAGEAGRRGHADKARDLETVARSGSAPARTLRQRKIARLARVGGLLVLVTLLGLAGWYAWRSGKLSGLAKLPGAEVTASLGSEPSQAEAETEPGTERAQAAVQPASLAPQSPWKIRHEGHIPIKGGVLYAPATFVPGADGSYDLIVHFHGNTSVVRESVEVAGINAMVAVVNLGIGSAVYREAYEAPGTWERLLEQIDRGVRRCGVPEPKLRRIALTGWSAGYAAIGSVLTFRSGADPIDAILMLDGIHASWREEDPSQMKPQVLRIFEDAARLAADGRILFTMTHSEIEPPFYAGTASTAEYLLRSVGAEPVYGTMFQVPEHLKLKSAEHAVSRRLEKKMVPIAETRVGLFHVRGYAGDTREHHMAHLLQMAATVLPELKERWDHPTAPLLDRLRSALGQASPPKLERSAALVIPAAAPPS